MKKILSIIMMLLMTVAMYSQKDITTFLGIPVDGTEFKMKRKLIRKGFTYNSYGEYFKGTFNDKTVKVYIVTNNKKVYRIAVFDAYECDEKEIKYRFNELCRQFNESGKYVQNSYLRGISNLIIPEDEDIYKEIKENKKEYSAIFYQTSEYTYLGEIFHKVNQKLLKEYTGSEKGVIEEDKEEELSERRLRESLQILEDIQMRCVWFKIDESYGKYRILMYYDNKYNKSNGADL